MTTRCGDFPECATCLNREFDPFQCKDCEDASNYEPEEEGDSEDISYEDFKSIPIFFRETA